MIRFYLSTYKSIISNSKGYLGTFTVFVLTCVCIQSRSFVLESHACCYSSQPFCQQSPFLCYLYCIRQFSLHACILYVSETCLMLVWCQREEEKKWILTLCVPIFIQSTSRKEEIFFPGYLLPIEDDNILAGVFQRPLKLGVERLYQWFQSIMLVYHAHPKYTSGYTLFFVRTNYNVFGLNFQYICTSTTPTPICLISILGVSTKKFNNISFILVYNLKIIR